MLPLIIPGIITLVIFSIYISWTDYLLAFIIMNSADMQMLNVTLSKIGFRSVYPYAGYVISYFPFMIVFILLQKYSHRCGVPHAAANAFGVCVYRSSATWIGEFTSTLCSSMFPSESFWGTETAMGGCMLIVLENRLNRPRLLFPIDVPLVPTGAYVWTSGCSSPSRNALSATDLA